MAQKGSVDKGKDIKSSIRPAISRREYEGNQTDINVTHNQTSQSVRQAAIQPTTSNHNESNSTWTAAANDDDHDNADDDGWLVGCLACLSET